jgi:hypothetical protein
VAPDQTTASAGSTSTSSVRDELAADASRLGDTARERAKEEAGTRKQQVTQTARSASSALSKAADDLDQDDGAPSWLSSAFRQTASGIERLAGDLEGRSPDDLARNLTRFARENPVAFLAGSAAAGFVAARFLKAGAGYRNEHRYDPQAAADNSGGTDAPAATTPSAGFGQAPAAGYGGTSSPAEAAGYGSNSLQQGGAR